MQIYQTPQSLDFSAKQGQLSVIVRVSFPVTLTEKDFTHHMPITELRCV